MRPAHLLCILMLLVTLAVYAQTANHDFINFDDTLYVTTNPVVKDGLKAWTIAWAFTATTASNWHPVTWLSHMTDVQLFGLNPYGHHLTSVIIHTLSALLLFLLLAQITAAPWQSLFVATLFALHPLHVESVAWVAERKDVLSGLFWTLTLLLYARYVKNPGAGRYGATLACFAVGLMTKPMLVTLPLVMLLLDWWPLNRFCPAEGGGTAAAKPAVFKLAMEKIPFLLLSVLSSAFTIYAQHHGGAMATLDKAPLGLRFGNAVIAYATYIVDAFWPHDLAMLYPFPTFILLGQLVGAALLLALISAGVLYVGRRFPWLAVGWLWFLITLLPVIGLVQVGGQSHADRYTYIPLTGLFIMLAWGVPQLLEKWRCRREALMISAGLAVCAITATTWVQIGYWRNNITLYRHTLAVTRNNYLILNNYGIAMDQAGDYESALQLYQDALRIWPRSVTAHNNIGTVLERKGRYAEAIEHYREALRLKPDYVMAVVNMGKSLAGLGKVDEALTCYERALKLDPSNSDGHLQLAILLLKSGRRDEARQHYEAVLRLEPHSARAPVNIGVELAQQGRFDEAADYFRQALGIDPDSVEANFNYGVFLTKQNRNNEAAGYFRQVLRIKPDSAMARDWLRRLRQLE
ncbi:tetratricopeptide repeat protein [Geomonas agri]|uniref:tetratricopeptide repeat protein n=1 Tax=Geomonas agri TaxID=2873702 RepID=UPI001CD1A057|nr:tetratricopeptide repeat protein [Geomonas agri]